MRSRLFLVFTFVSLIIITFGAARKEMVLQSGKVFYLKLQPVDPRAFMQGDKMRLNYEINYNKNDYLHMSGACLMLDEKQIGIYITDMPKDKCTDSGNIWLKMQKTNFKFITDSYFFQEGMADKYIIAKYAILKYDGQGSAMLTGLAYETMQEIE